MQRSRIRSRTIFVKKTIRRQIIIFIFLVPSHLFLQTSYIPLLGYQHIFCLSFVYTLVPVQYSYKLTLLPNLTLLTEYYLNLEDIRELELHVHCGLQKSLKTTHGFRRFDPTSTYGLGSRGNIQPHLPTLVTCQYPVNPIYFTPFVNIY